MKKQKGFTLIELLIVIVIIGILAALVVGLIGRSSRQKAEDAKRKGGIREIQNALEAYHTDNNAYPDPTSWSTVLAPSYLKAIPTEVDASTPWDYSATTPFDAYTLRVQLENQNDNGDNIVVDTGTGTKYYEVESKQ